jgi:glycosyltransferase involved in cell wall biosynthesis
MSVLYHLATLRPKMPQAEAISQEISTLREQFDGDVVHVNPNQQSALHIPRFLFGFHKLRGIRSLEASLHLHHIYNPDPYPFPYLRALRRPLIYSVTCGVGDRQPNRAFFASMAAIAVSDRRSLDRLESWGFDNVALVHPGIDTGRFSHSPLPLRSEIILMVGSAPWTRSQFRTKGVDALLSTAKQEPRLRLVFLWRGVLADEMRHRVLRMDLDNQVTVLNRFVDVNSVLAGVHASITLANSPGIVKSYPHSLLESLAAGKPVLVSRAIPMADYVEQTGCGRVVDSVSPTHILAAIESLAAKYATLRESAQEVGHRDFSEDRLVDSSRDMYERVLGHSLSRDQGSR